MQEYIEELLDKPVMEFCDVDEEFDEVDDYSEL